MSFTVQEATKVLAQKFLMQEGIAGVSHRSKELIVYVETPEAATGRAIMEALGYRVAEKVKPKE